MTDGGSASRRLQGVQVLRGLAAVAVALFHASLTLAQPKYGGRIAFGGWMGWGDVGVDVFFILSGFIILHAHRADIGQPKRWAHYIYRRASRIYPIYWILTSALLLTVAVGFGGASKLFSFWDYLTSYLLVRFSDVAPPVGTAWTLFHEILFYALFSLLLLNRRIGLVVMALWLGAILWTFNPDGGTFTGVFTSLFNLYFFLGMSAFLIWKHGRLPARLTCGLAGLLFLTFIVLDHAVGRFQAPYLRLLVAPGAVLLLVGLSALDREKRASYPAWLLFLGNASYSIYLLHYELYAALARFLVAMGWMARLPADLCVILFFAVAIGISAAIYQFVERPLLRRFH